MGGEGGWHTERSGDLSAMLRCSDGDSGDQGGESAGQVCGRGWHGPRARVTP